MPALQRVVDLSPNYPFKSARVYKFATGQRAKPLGSGAVGNQRSLIAPQDNDRSFNLNLFINHFGGSSWLRRYVPTPTDIGQHTAVSYVVQCTAQLPQRLSSSKASRL
eukprot:4814565-Amphidinium_carterae.1